VAVSADGSGSSIKGTLHAAAAVSAPARDAMYALLASHFEGVTRAQFEGDLQAKSHALLLRDGSGRLTGFSTLLLRETHCDGSPIDVLYSGDTVVDPAAWRSPALPREWIAAVNGLRRHDRPLHWLLITSGFRTYRLLSTFWREFHPRFDAPMPDGVRQLRDQLAIANYGAAYDPSTGLVRFTAPQILRPHLAGVPDARRIDPHVEFFDRINPGHARGDELACLCRIDEANLTRAGRRMVLGAGHA
jgi:hypothetical protein